MVPTLRWLAGLRPPILLVGGTSTLTLSESELWTLKATLGIGEVEGKSTEEEDSVKLDPEKVTEVEEVESKPEMGSKGGGGPLTPPEVEEGRKSFEGRMVEEGGSVCGKVEVSTKVAIPPPRLLLSMEMKVLPGKLKKIENKKKVERNSNFHFLILNNIAINLINEITKTQMTSE